MSRVAASVFWDRLTVLFVSYACLDGQASGIGRRSQSKPLSPPLAAGATGTAELGFEAPGLDLGDGFDDFDIVKSWDVDDEDNNDDYAEGTDASAMKKRRRWLHGWRATYTLTNKGGRKASTSTKQQGRRSDGHAGTSVTSSAKVDDPAKRRCRASRIHMKLQKQGAEGASAVDNQTTSPTKGALRSGPQSKSNGSWAALSGHVEAVNAKRRQRLARESAAVDRARTTKASVESLVQTRAMSCCSNLQWRLRRKLPRGPGTPGEFAVCPGIVLSG